MQRHLIIAFLTATSLSAAPSFAQTSADGAETGAMGDIVVTARRKEERLQDVPVAVSVLTGDTLQRQNIQSLAEFQRAVPSLTITPSSGRANSANIMIRGQRQTDNTIFADPSVQTYINEVNAARTSGLDTTAFDLESVQVLKGPQGTLFGRNSTGGALLLTTRKPGNSFGGYIKAYIEDPVGAGLEGAIDIPIAEGAALRLAGNYQYRRGYSYVVNLDQHLDDKNRWAGRATLDLQPTDTLRSTFVGEMFKSNENGIATYAFNYSPGASGSAAVLAGAIAVGYPAAYAQSQALDFHQLTATLPGLSRYRSYAVSNTTTLELSDNITLKNIAGWRKVKGHDIVDQDGTVATVIQNDGRSGGSQFSEELQLQGNSFDDNLDWVVGGYYFRESGYDSVKTYTLKVPTGSHSNNNYGGVNKSLSAFAHFSYTLPFDAPTHIYGGIRYTKDTRQIDFRNRRVADDGSITCTVVGATNANCSLIRSTDFKRATWEIGVDHKISDASMVYATVNTGYRAGGFLGRATNLKSQEPFRPELVTNYEIGAKNSFRAGGATTTLNFAAYFSDYKDIQRTVIINIAPAPLPPLSGTTLVNAASARIWGLEGEFSTRVNAFFSANAFFSYTNARYRSFLETNPITNVTSDLSANKFLGVPEFQWGAGVEVTVVDNDSGRVSLAPNITFTDKYELSDNNAPGGQASSVALVNAFVNWDNIAGSQVSGSVYVKNLLDTDYYPSGLLLQSALDVNQTQHGAPRVVGAMLRMNF